MRRVVAVAVVAAAVLLAMVIGASGGSGGMQQGAIAYVTGNGATVPTVWLSGVRGAGARPLGPGSSPRLSPNGRLVAAASVAGQSQALTIYRSSGGVAARLFNRSDQTALAQAWSGDSRYLAVVLSSTNPASNTASGLAVIDTRSESVRVLARGTIYGASFAPDATDRIVYSRAANGSLAARVNIHVASIDGAGDSAITHDGHSLNPLWGRLGIAFDRERLRRHADPEYQLYMMNPEGADRIRVTDLREPTLSEGLVPLAFSADGSRLLAEDEGAEISQAWTVDLGTHAVHKLVRNGHSVVGAGISRSGGEVLADRNGYLNPPDSGIVEQLQFAGPGATMLIAHGSQPSWNL